MPQQPAASRPGAVPHVLLPGTMARTGAEGGAQAPAGAPLQHTALRKTLWKKTVEVVEKPERRVRRAGKATPMQIDLETGAMLEDGSEEELAAWVQLSRATRDHATPCEPQDETCPF